MPCVVEQPCAWWSWLLPAGLVAGDTNPLHTKTSANQRSVWHLCLGILQKGWWLLGAGVIKSLC